MSDSHDDSHGSSPAAWTGVGIMLVATALICLGMVLEISVMWIAGIVGFLVGILAWVGMGRAAAAKADGAAARR